MSFLIRLWNPNLSLISKINRVRVLVRVMVRTIVRVRARIRVKIFNKVRNNRIALGVKIVEVLKFFLKRLKEF